MEPALTAASAIALAASIAEPPPNPTMKSIFCVRQSCAAASHSSAVGLGDILSKSTIRMPLCVKSAMTRAKMPVRFIEPPLVVTKRAFAPGSGASAKRFKQPGPKYRRVGKLKRNDKLVCMALSSNGHNESGHSRQCKHVYPTIRSE